jgi:nucleoside 2-deoxyribosyltransferase
MHRLKAYLAGPDVFLPDAVAVGHAKREICAAHGLEGHYPLDSEVAGGNPRDMAMTISRLNEELVARCDIVLANLTPFRSPSLDPGTAFEIGFARALGKRIYGYSADTATLPQRTRRFFALADDAAADPRGYAIEDFGLTDNLMIDGAIDAGGGFIIAKTEPSLAALGAFRALVERIAQAAR